MYAGSAIFAVIYSSVTIWAALLSRVLMQRVLTIWQWCGIFVVFFGLAITGFEAKNQGDRVFLGASMVTMGAFLHALSHALSEFTSVRGAKIPPYVNSCVQGTVNFLIVGTWQCTYTASHWEKIADPMEEAGTSWGRASLLLGGVAVGNLVHAATFFYLLTSIGVVSTGVLKSVQSVAVFCMSHVLYCEHDESQCFTPVKGISLIVVVCGVLCYVLATGAAQKTKKLAHDK
jgi:drug/metabolite transporter (DMT)-like permease